MRVLHRRADGGAFSQADAEKKHDARVRSAMCLTILSEPSDDPSSTTMISCPKPRQRERGDAFEERSNEFLLIEQRDQN